MSKAILINDLGNGGAERVVSHIINNMDDDVFLINIWKNDFNLVKNDKRIYLLESRKNLPYDLFIAFFKLIKVIKDNKISSVNSHLFWSNYLNVFSSLFVKHKTICTHCVSFDSKFEKKNVKSIFHGFLVKFLLKHSKLHTYKSHDMKVEYESRFNLKNGMVIYNPVFYDSILEKAKSNCEFKWNSEKVYVLVVGRFHKTKNQMAIIKSIPKVKEKFSFIFLGDGDELYNCKEMANELGVSERVFFLGQVNNPYPFFKRSKIYLSASLSEGFPNALIEAISLGCYPIVLDCKTGPREILSLFYSTPEENEFDFGFLYSLGFLLNSDSTYDISEAINFFDDEKYNIKPHVRNELISNLQSDKILFMYEKAMME
ncbi:glycosyltransferase [Vibrio parahaemolyticus]